jgi:hypothetical protein
MTRVALTSGSYEARSVIASAARSVNLFAESNPKDAPAPFTFYGCPGLTSLVKPVAKAPGRGLYWANNGALYYVTGSTVYIVRAETTTPFTWSMTKVGSIASSSGRVSMVDNGTTLVIVDGSALGYQVDLVSNQLKPINAVNNNPDPPTAGAVFAFYGADRVDIIDGFMVLNQPGTRNFYSTYLNEVKFDSLFFAAKNGYSDNLVTIIVMKREIWLVGERTSEIWFDAGAADFPFQIMPGPFVQHGCIAKSSIAQANGSAFWLSQDQNGQAIVVRTEGYDAKRISNFALETAMAKYPKVTDAEAFTFQQRGHTFYQINFPSADRSWRWDETVPDQWHEPLWTDVNGVEHRHRAACSAFAYGKNVVADWETGELYALDPENHTDNGAPMHYRRGFPHMVGDGKQVIYPGFTLDVEAATGLGTVDPPGPFPLLTGASGVNSAPPIDAGPVEDALLAGPAPLQATAPLVYLRWSDDRGRTYGNPIPQSLGAQGDYRAQPQWNRLGRARDRVFEIYGVIPGRFAVMGAFLDPAPIPIDN